MSNEQPGLSATEWRYMYFLGISKYPVDQIDLHESQVSGLLSIIELSTVISCGAAIEPKYLINKKGTTPWIAMYALVRINDPEALTLIAAGKTRAHIPTNFIRAGFGDHINWPEQMISQYDLALGDHTMFAIPFLVHESVQAIGSFTQSMKAPDGSLEIFGAYEFRDELPEELLMECAALTSFIKQHRPDEIQ